MSEQWAICLLTGVVAWVAYELHQAREDIKNLVSKEDCSTDMGEHCAQIKDIRAKVQENSEQIATINAKVNAFHNNNN